MPPARLFAPATRPPLRVTDPAGLRGVIPEEMVQVANRSRVPRLRPPRCLTIDLHPSAGLICELGSVSAGGTIRPMRYGSKMPLSAEPP